jgi:hypothetical protein
MTTTLYPTPNIQRKRQKFKRVGYLMFAMEANLEPVSLDLSDLVFSVFLVRLLSLSQNARPFTRKISSLASRCALIR